MGLGCAFGWDDSGDSECELSVFGLLSETVELGVLTGIVANEHRMEGDAAFPSPSKLRTVAILPPSRTAPTANLFRRAASTSPSTPPCAASWTAEIRICRTTRSARGAGRAPHRSRRHRL